MFAVVQISGKQYKIKENDILEVEKIKGKENQSIEISQILLFVNEKGEVKIGKPLLKNHKAEAVILSQTKGKKVISFKYKPKKGYHRKKGHRSLLTKILIKKIK